MWTQRSLLALPLALAATLGTANAASVRDRAGLFSPDAVRQAEAELNRVERDNQLSATVETVDSLEGNDIGDVTREHAARSGTGGLYVVIAKKENKIDVRASRQYSRAINDPRVQSIRQAFIGEFKKHDFDAGLLAGVRSINSEVSAARSENGGRLVAGAPGARPGAAVPARRGNPQGGFGMSSLLGIGLLVVGGLFLVRLLGSLFGGNRGYAGGGPGRMGAPGYGGGGGGGGFMSGMFGGIGGALAGNWLYDQFSGRSHGGSVESSATSGPAETGGDDWNSGSNASGDWGGGDAGGGGDWGGGGGGGGGDWGGGGGGGGGDW